MKFDYLLEKYISYHKSLCHSEKTIKNYVDILNSFNHIVKVDDYSDFSIVHISKYQDYLNSRKISVATYGSYMRHVKAFVHWLGICDHIDDNLLYTKISVPKAPKKIVKIYNSLEIKEIYNKCITSVPWITARNKLIISLMLDAGLRRHEVTLINKVDLTDDILVVHGKGRKDRLVSLGFVISEHMQSYIKECPYNMPYLFATRRGSALTDNSIKQFISKLSEQLSFEFSCHKLRHNFATNFLIDSYDKNGFYDAYTLQILLGHEDLRTTDRYVHLAAQYIATRKRVSHLDNVYKKGL